MRTNPEDTAFSAPPVRVGERELIQGKLGLLKREYFAIAALQGILANEEVFKSIKVDPIKSAVKMADELIKELNKNESEVDNAIKIG
jgi:hypothetical protein